MTLPLQLGYGFRSVYGLVFKVAELGFEALGTPLAFLAVTANTMQLCILCKPPVCGQEMEEPHVHGIQQHVPTQVDLPRHSQVFRIFVQL